MFSVARENVVQLLDRLLLPANYHSNRYSLAKLFSVWLGLTTAAAVKK